MRTLCVIPARYASTRLPGKPLADICGKPMICRVWERARRAEKPERVIVATDDQRIYDAVRKDGGEAMLTRADHPTGTDRLAEVAQAHAAVDLIVNVQGDEPLIEPSVIDELIALFEADENLQMATVMTRMEDEEEQKNPNNVRSSPIRARQLRPCTSTSASTPIGATSCCTTHVLRRRLWRRRNLWSSFGRSKMATASACWKRPAVSSASIRRRIWRSSTDSIESGGWHSSPSDGGCSFSCF